MFDCAVNQPEGLQQPIISASHAPPWDNFIIYLLIFEFGDRKGRRGGGRDFRKERVGKEKEPTTYAQAKY